MYFTSISSINEAELHLPPNLPPCRSSLHDIDILEQDVTDIIKCLPPNKACGPDFISHTLLRESLPIIAQPLMKIFNLSISNSKFPDAWKLANVSPIFKSKEPYLTKNYRPISLLSCVSKVFERCVFKYFFNYLRDNELISTNQSAYSPSDSTVNQLVSIFHETCTALDENIDTQLIFFDISKAFDRVWHRGLLYKLQSIGICGRLLLWFKDYLNNRRQKVVLKGNASSVRTLQAGVPQGSVLGPILFLIYINDISNSVGSVTKLYADDTSLLKRITDKNTSTAQLQEDLGFIDEWSKKWEVNFNPNKSHSLLISRKRAVTNKHDYVFQNQLIENVSEHTHLGLIWNTEGTWVNHLQSIYKRGSKRIDILRALKRKLDRYSLEVIYLLFIRPLF